MSEEPSGADEEIAFWRGAIRRYLDKPESSAFGAKLHPERPLQDAIDRRVRQALAPDQDQARVLDVGCGPVSTVGKKADGFDVTVVGLDPLADAYQSLFDEAHLQRPHESVNGFAERASEYFGTGAFDYVHAENSLDHCQDPATALSEIRKTCKPDAIFYFKVFVNEGEHNHYSGLHQWNFDTYDGKVIFWRPGEIHFIDEVFRLPVKVWYEDAVHGPNRIMRRYLNCEVHNTDLETGFVQVGALWVRYLPRYSSIVLKRGAGLVPDLRIFAHFGFEDAPRQVATLIWPEDHAHHILQVPSGRLLNIKLGQSRKHLDSVGKQRWEEIWSGFVPDLPSPRSENP